MLHKHLLCEACFSINMSTESSAMPTHLSTSAGCHAKRKDKPVHGTFRREFLTESQTMWQRRKAHMAEVSQRRMQLQKEKHEHALQAAGVALIITSTLSDFGDQAEPIRELILAWEQCYRHLPALVCIFVSILCNLSACI